MSSEFKIIRATHEHLDLIVPLFDAYRKSYGQSSDAEGARRFLSERLERDQSMIFLALTENGGCGFTQLYPSYSSVSMQPIWILNDLFVTPEARRIGVSTSLIKTATEFAAGCGAKRLVLATAVDNHPAQSLYEKLGWVRDNAFLHYNFGL